LKGTPYSSKFILFSQKKGGGGGGGGGEGGGGHPRFEGRKKRLQIQKKTP